MPEQVRIIGIDVATNPKNVGLALCTLAEGRAQIEEVMAGRTWPAIDERVASWIDGPSLLALDAPLGWPSLLGESLHAHSAGAAFDHAPNTMFRRATDDAVAQRLGKRPLDVGSDRIARTAHAALSFFARLRDRLDLPIPLAWNPDRLDGVSAIEVYPAGTLAASGLPSSGYKGAKDGASGLRQELTAALHEELSFGEPTAQQMARSDHVLDAVLCAFAGLDFLAGRAPGPDDLPRARQEGWIWVRRRD